MVRTLPPTLAALTLAACFASTPVTDAPLPASQQKTLHCLLQGTWALEKIDGEPISMVIQLWTFNEDGTGLYRQRPTGEPGSALAVSGDRLYKWSLKGRNLSLALGGTTTVYRIDDFQPKSMQWFNYTMSNQYAVARDGAPLCKP